jgi:hypothetical protein
MSCRGEGRPTGGRSGLAVPAVMLGIFLAGVLGVSILQSILVRHRIQRREAEELQCRLLLHSGLERAAARLAREPDFSGELWEIDEEWLAGEVEIEVLERVTELPEQQWVRVTARFPAEPVWRIQLSDEFLIRRDVRTATSARDR